MNVAFKRTGMGAAAVGMAGVSVFAVGMPASAAPSCGVGTMIEPNVCELVFTADGQFIPTAEMTKLEVLLVGAGGSALTIPAETTGYAAAGGGGEVKVVGFTPTAAPIDVTVPVPGGILGGVNDGTTAITVANGADGAEFTDIEEQEFGANGGASGNGNLGSSTTSQGTPVGGGGSSAAAGGTNGGAGTVVNAIAPVGSLFATDTACYGGGGAAGLPEQQGIPSCGGGGPNDDTSTVFAPTANSGGGGGSVGEPTGADNVGANGLIVFRWVPIEPLPATGGTPNALLISAGLAALFAGAALAVMASRRKRAGESA
jgi:LPXTG-motif cell wall-anchored protein